MIRAFAGSVLITVALLGVSAVSEAQMATQEGRTGVFGFGSPDAGAFSAIEAFRQRVRPREDRPPLSLPDAAKLVKDWRPFQHPWDAPISQSDTEVWRWHVARLLTSPFGHSVMLREILRMMTTVPRVTLPTDGRVLDDGTLLPPTGAIVPPLARRDRPGNPAVLAGAVTRPRRPGPREL